MNWANILDADTIVGNLKVALINFVVGMVKNGCGILGNRTLKSGMFWEWLDKLSSFFSYW